MEKKILQRQPTPATANLFRQYKQNKQRKEEEDIRECFSKTCCLQHIVPAKPQRHLFYIFRTIKVFTL